MKILKCLLLFFTSLPVSICAQTVLKNTETIVQSPNGAYQFRFYQKQSGYGEKQMYYTLMLRDREVIKESELGVLIENQLFESALAIPNDSCKMWGDNLKVTEVERTSVNETWKPVYGERNTIYNRYNEAVIKFMKGGNEGTSEGGYDKKRYYYMNLIVRAYNEGVAFRYVFPEAANGLFLHITGEQTQFTFPEGTLAYYERWAQGPYSLLPLKDWNDECERPLTLKLLNGLTVALAEANLTDYTRMKFQQNKDKKNTLQALLYSAVDVITPYETPWRVIMVAEKPAELVMNNDIILNLNAACQIKDISWIKPGKAIRVARLTQADAKKCVDFAAARGLQYIHLDAGWYGPEMKMESDATKVGQDKDFNMEELTMYAASKGIGVFLYVNQRALIRQLDEILPLYKKMGIKGVKFGFVQVGNQYWTTWLHNAVIKCAEYGLLVDIHDEYRPTGFSRTYPNLLTQEGIRGNEEMPEATHNTILPFTRFLAGAGDYTICYYNNRIKTTHTHQLALSVVFYSPLQFLYWYDQPLAYQGEPEIEFFDKVKTVWEDSKVIDGVIGEYIITARRSGNAWFVGAITNTAGRKLKIPLDFLERGEDYTAKIYYDDPLATTRTKVGIRTLKVNSRTILEADLSPSGGQAVLIEKNQK